MGINATVLVTLLSQLYVEAPEPNNVTGSPIQTAVSLPADTLGKPKISNVLVSTVYSTAVGKFIFNGMCADS